MCSPTGVREVFESFTVLEIDCQVDRGAISLCIAEALSWHRNAPESIKVEEDWMIHSTTQLTPDEVTNTSGSSSLT